LRNSRKRRRLDPQTARDGGFRGVTSPLHRQRLAAIVAELRKSGAGSVIDLGCGNGELLACLARDNAFERIAGLDISAEALRQARRRLRLEFGECASAVRLVEGSIMETITKAEGFDAAVLVETIEHIEPDRLSRVETTVFRELAPLTVIVTTPNSEYNPLLGVPPHRFRHPDHRFEWNREKFRSWAGGVARRTSYVVSFSDLPFSRPAYGGPTQMAVFSRPDGIETMAA
jgi:3' terminal RNA ribose 2'-O-methyltransferase Hen1